jgi:hypothetical protein
MEEEISLEEKHTTACVPLVDELLQKYCGGLKQKVCNANSRKQSELIVHQAHKEFEKRCVSEIIPLLLKRHFEKLIQLCWGNQK